MSHYPNTHIDVSLDSLDSACHSLEFSADELSRSKITKLQREAKTIRLIEKQVKKVIALIYKRRPE